MSYQQDNDKLYRYLFQDRVVRGEWVRLNETYETLEARITIQKPYKTY